MSFVNSIAEMDLDSDDGYSTGPEPVKPSVAVELNLGLMELDDEPPATTSSSSG